MTTFAVIAGCVGAGAFAILVGLLLFAPRGHRVSRFLIGATVVSMLWFGASAIYYNSPGVLPINIAWLQLLELLRNALWLLFLARLLDTVGIPAYRRNVRLTTIVLLAITLCAAVAIAFPYPIQSLLDADQGQTRKLTLISILLVVLGGLILIEQLFRNSTRDSRWALKHMCFGLGLIFAYDFYLYADAVLFNRVDAAIWNSRGLVNAMAVPMLAGSASRNRQWQLDIFVSRLVVCYGVPLIAYGGYFMTMDAAG